MAELVKYNRFPSLRSMLDNFWNNDWMGNEFDRRDRLPAVNVKETDKCYEIEVAVPGMKKEDFKIDVDNGVLTISAEQKEEQEKKEDNYTRKEFSYSSFSRSFSLPQNVNEDSINAKYENGVLALTLDKAKEEKPKKRQIPLS
jgi:HSP20 family protein